MYKDYKILAIIPARGGSKGLPGKNIKKLMDKPLIAWTIEQAKKSKYVDEIFISTDSQEIANIAEQFGIKVSNLRPAYLAEDHSPSSDFVIYTLDILKQSGKEFDFVVLLEPTSPLRKKDDIDKAIELLDSKEGVDGVVSIGEVHMEHPMIVKRVTADNSLISYISDVEKITQRQMADKAYFPYGVIYLTRCDSFRKSRSFYAGNVVPYIIDRWQNYEIDDICDFLCVETILKHQNNY